MSKQRKTVILFLIIFASGATALVYEILWEKKLELVFGTTVEGLTVVLSVFFAGLAIGSFIFGKISDKLSFKKLLITYGLVEIGIGMFSFGSPFIFENLGKVSLIFLLFPATLIGGTFPIITRYFATQESLKDKVSILYALNTLGGVLGVLAATFWLIKTFGVNGGIWIAASINVTLGTITILLGSWVKNSDFKNKKKSLESQPSETGGGILLFVVFFTGLFALALEVFWTKTLVLVFGGSLYSFAAILVAFLLGIALGSFFARFLAKERAWFWFGTSQALIAIWVFLSLPLFNKLPSFFVSLFEKGSFNQLIWVSFLISTIVILPATFFSGVSFPLAMELYRGKFRGLGEGVGRVYAANTLGAVLGPLVAYYLLLPLLGIQKSIILLAFGYGLISLYFLIKQRKLSVVILIILLILFVSNLSIFGWDKQELTAGRYLYPDFSVQSSELLYYKEGKNATVAVRKTAVGDTVLHVDGKADASALADLDTELLLGYIPMLFSKKPNDVLVIGLGSGITAGAVLTYPVEKVDIVEIEAGVVEAASYFSEYNNDVLSEKRVSLLVNDARNHLLGTNKKYDVITSEPSNPWISGVGNLFSGEFYESAKAHLKEEGIMFQWIHTYGMSEDTLKIAIRTFSQVFPQTSLWSNWLGSDIFLMGSVKAPEMIESVPQEVVEDFDRIYTSPAQIIDFYVAGDKVIREEVGQGKIHSDNFPWLEILAPIDLYKKTNDENLSFLLSLRPENELRYLIFREEFEEALRISPENRFLEKAYSGRLINEAKDQKDRNEYTSARELLEKAIKLNPKNFLPYRLLGEIHLLQEKPDSALEVLTKSVDIFSYDPKSYIFLGVAHGMREEWGKAESMFLKAIEINPKNILAWNNLAKTYLDQGKNEQAKGAWKKSLKINSDQPEIKASMRISQ